MRVGIFGGTFDPVHHGHLAIAEEARVVCELQQVIFIPAARQPLKPNGHGATPAQRLEMVRLAIAGAPHFAVSAVEVERPGPSYTVTTLETLHASGLHDLSFIVGADALDDMHRWHRIERILELAQIIGVARPDTDLDMPALLHDLPLLEGRLTLIDGPRLAISSTALRSRIAAGLPIRYQMPDAVVEYIERQGLYRGSSL